MTRRVASSRLIGRSSELAELRAALRDAADGRPSLVFVSGESGVGKTRLLTELMRAGREEGTLVLAGETVDFGAEGELPYLPLVAALRPLARRGDPALTGPVREALAPLLPGPEATAAARASSSDRHAQGELFEGLLALLDALGQERPVLLVIEDLHWADRSTRAALAFLARSLTSERALLVASYRPDELPHRRHPLRSLLAELERHPRARRIPLEPLSRDQLAAQLTDILGAAPADDLLERLWSRTGGNPLWGEELLAAGLDGRGAAPDTLRDALMLRVERLSEPARALVSLLAVGQRLDHGLLQETSGLEPDGLRDALREAVDGHIVVAQDDGDYRFRHALLREVVEEDLLPGERGELHLVLARALEQRLEDGAGAQVAAAVAHHYHAAGDEPAALTAAVRAATNAERAHAYGEAVSLLERALKLWQRVPDPETHAGADHVTLYMRAADAAGALGDPARQLDLLESALAGLGPQPDRRRAAEILESTARAQRHLNRAKESIATLERARELVERDVQDDDDPSVRAGLLAGHARALMIVGRFRDAADVAGDALRLAGAANLPIVEGNARNTLGYSIGMTGDADAGAVQLRTAIRIAREHESLSDLAVAYVNYADMLHALGRSAEAHELAAEGRRAVDSLHPIGMMWLDVTLAEVAFDVGEWDAAEAALPAERPGTGTQLRLLLLLRRAMLAAGRGDHAAATAILHELEPLGAESSEPQSLVPVTLLVAELRRREKDLEAARAAVEQGLERIERVSDDTMPLSAVAAAGVTVEAEAAERARDLGDAEGERTALRRADVLLARVAAAADETRPIESAALLGARAETGRAAGRPDPAEYARAAAAWEEIGRPEPAARMRWREAEAYAAAGDRAAASAAAQAAHAAATRIGAGWLRGEIEALVARARLSLEAPEDGRHQDEEDAFGLTARERQVLALIAKGATNREIGATLFMAEKTASVHVSRILSKLNARSRTEAAAVAHRHGMAESGPP